MIAVKDKITFRYTNDDMTTLMKVLAASGKEIYANGDINNKLLGVMLVRIALRMHKQLLLVRDKYTFNFVTEEGLAFYLAFDQGVIYSRNQHTQYVILLPTFETIKKNLAIEV